MSEDGEHTKRDDVAPDVAPELAPNADPFDGVPEPVLSTGESSAEPLEAAPDAEPRTGEPYGFAEFVTAGPWKRYFARQLDLIVPSIAALGLAFALSSGATWALAVVGVVPVVLWIVPEAVLLSSLGTTPGKWLMGLRLATADGSRPLLDYTLRRSLSVALKGMALNIPLLNIYAPIRAYQQLRNQGITSWDETSGFQVIEHRRVGPIQVGAVLVVASLVTFGATQLLTLSMANQGISAARSQAESKMRPLRDEAAQVMADSGVELELVGEPFAPLIAAGAAVSQTIRLEQGEGRLAMATCDADCLDLDLAVIDPEGFVIAQDYAPDAEPVALFLAPEAGDYTIAIELPRCTTQGCVALLEVHDIAGYAYESGGTCFVVSDAGHVLTARHVVEGSSGITVTLGDGRMRTGELAEVLPDDDVALVRVDAQTPEFMHIASTQLRLGDPVMTIGYPLTDLLGSSAKYSEGTVAALNGPNGDPFLFQMSAQVQPGSSGGPVLNRDGEVVGLVTATADEMAFFAQSGSMPQDINWATKAYRFRDLAPPASGRSTRPRSTDIVEQSRRAVCRVEARFEAKGR